MDRIIEENLIMLRTTDFIREFKVDNKTDRDAEIPLLLEFLKNIQFESLLDIGAHYSNHKGYSYYAPEVRKLAKRYDGIDLLDDPEVKQVLDNYFVGNANEYQLEQYDIVICVSTIEHTGVSTYKKENIQQEQNKLFSKCLDLATKYMWISFPTGFPYVYPNELSIITEPQLINWELEIKRKSWKIRTERFLHNQAGPQFNTPWREHRKREAACKQQYWDYCGNQSITVFELER